MRPCTTRTRNAIEGSHTACKDTASSVDRILDLITAVFLIYKYRSIHHTQQQLRVHTAVRTRSKCTCGI